MDKIKTVGTKAEVFNNKAKHTSGGLKKPDLIRNKGGKIVSKNASAAAKKNNNLVKAGYVTQKGKFGAIYTGGKKKSPTKSPKKKDSKNKSFSFF